PEMHTLGTRQNRATSARRRRQGVRTQSWPTCNHLSATSAEMAPTTAYGSPNATNAELPCSDAGTRLTSPTSSAPNIPHTSGGRSTPNTTTPKTATRHNAPSTQSSTGSTNYVASSTNRPATSVPSSART